MTAPIIACSGCGAEHPRTAEFFVNFPGRGYVSRRCRECGRKAAHGRRQRTIDRTTAPGFDPYSPVREKVCSGCAVSYKTTKENFGRCAAAGDGLNWRCRSCARVVRAIEKEENKKQNSGPDFDPYAGHKFKYCGTCGRSHPRTAFGINRRTRDGLMTYCKKVTRRLAKARRKPPTQEPA